GRCEPKARHRRTAGPRGQAQLRVVESRAWSRRGDSNPRPAAYEAAALPAELRRRREGSLPADRRRKGSSPSPVPRFSIRAVDRHEVEQLKPEELDLIRPLLVDLHMDEQPHYPDHPQLTREQTEAQLAPVRSRFTGENLVLAV